MYQGKKTAFVSGGTGGIGTAICQELHAEGFFVVVGYYSGGDHQKAELWKKEQADLGFPFAMAYGEISDPKACEVCVEEVKEKFGPIDVLINNAGITRDATFRKMTFDQWRNVMIVDLDSVFVMTKLVIEDMIQAGWGRIINISSINAQKGQFGQTNYSAAKSGVHGFTKALAQEVSSKGITVNTVSPGYIETKVVNAIAPEIRKDVLKEIPVGRFGLPQDVAHLVAFLASEKASFITGANLAINGGQYMA